MTFYDLKAASPMLALPEGAQLIAPFITPRQEAWLMDHIDERPWDTQIGGRRQLYDDTDYNVASNTTAPVPMFLTDLGRHLTHQGIFHDIPQHVTVNEYLPGQGITNPAAQTNDPWHAVACLSLLSDIILDFCPTHLTNSNSVACHLPRLSLLVLHGPSRHQWTHSIAKRLIDHSHGVIIPRMRRVSITLRCRS